MALQTNRDIRRITIVGGGTSGYLAAFYLAKRYPKKQFTWIYPEENNPIGVGESCVPEVSRFFNKIGITSQDIIAHCSGSLKLGIKFQGFHTDNTTFTFPFGLGLGPEGKKFNTASIDLMMKTKKISPNIWKYTDTSVHFRATDILKYMDTLVGQFDNLKIERRSVPKTFVEDCKDTYDLLIDSTGFRRSISFQEDNFKSIEHIIPNNKALLFRHPYTNKEKQLLPYTMVTAMEHGWIWQIALTDHVACGYVHWDKFDVLDEFQTYLEDLFEKEIDTTNIRSIKMITGRNKVHLKDNVVAIGLASSFIEPLEATGLFLTTNAIEILCKYIDNEICENTYNDVINNDVDAITDFILAHYKYSDKTNEYWDYFKTVPLDGKSKISIFPQEAWDFILSAFVSSVARPKEALDTDELFAIGKGTPYIEWFENADNFRR